MKATRECSTTELLIKKERQVFYHRFRKGKRTLLEMCLLCTFTEVVVVQMHTDTSVVCMVPLDAAHLDHDSIPSA